MICHFLIYSISSSSISSEKMLFGGIEKREGFQEICIAGVISTRRASIFNLHSLKTNSILPWKIALGRWTFPLGWPFFVGYVNFWEGTKNKHICRPQILSETSSIRRLGIWHLKNLCLLLQGSLNGTHFGGIKLDATILGDFLRDFPYKTSAWSLGWEFIFHDPPVVLFLFNRGLKTPTPSKSRSRWWFGDPGGDLMSIFCSPNVAIVL